MELITNHEYGFINSYHQEQIKIFFENTLLTALIPLIHTNFIIYVPAVLVCIIPLQTLIIFNPNPTSNLAIFYFFMYRI